MHEHEIMIIADYSQTSVFTLQELCEICGISVDVVHELVEYDIIHPKYTTKHQVVFEMVDLQRAKTALRLQRDLELNFAGVVLVLNLLDELETLRKQAAFLERYL